MHSSHIVFLVTATEKNNSELENTMVVEHGIPEVGRKTLHVRKRICNSHSCMQQKGS